MSSYKFGISSEGRAYLELTAIPTEVEKKAIEELIAPDGFIMTQFFKKIKTLGEYTADIVAPNKGAKPTVTQDDFEAKPPLTSCPDCGRNTRAVRVVKKEGNNKGRKFYTCINKKCQHFEWKVD